MLNLVKQFELSAIWTAIIIFAILAYIYFIVFNEYAQDFLKRGNNITKKVALPVILSLILVVAFGLVGNFSEYGYHIVGALTLLAIYISYSQTETIEKYKQDTQPMDVTHEWTTQKKHHLKNSSLKKMQDDGDTNHLPRNIDNEDDSKQASCKQKYRNDFYPQYQSLDKKIYSERKMKGEVGGFDPMEDNFDNFGN